MKPTTAAALTMILAAMSLPASAYAEEPKPPVASPTAAEGAPLAPMAGLGFFPLPAKSSPTKPTRNDPGMMTAGLVLTGLAGMCAVPGSIATITGIVEFAMYGNNQGIPGAVTEGGVIVLGLCGVLAAIGVPLLVNGAKPKAGAAKWTSAIPTVAGDPHTVGLRWSF